MIKLVLKSDGNGEPLVLIGLTKENITQLMSGHPMLLRLSDLGVGVTGRVVFSYGEDKDAVIAEWRDAGIPVPDMPDPQPGEQIVLRP